MIDIFQMGMAYLIYITEEFMLDLRSFLIGMMTGLFCGAAIGLFVAGLCRIASESSPREHENGSDGL